MPSTTIPNDWFLENVPYTDGNKAESLIDGAAYFSESKTDIEALSNNSPYLFISGWRLNPDTLIDPSNQQEIRTLLEQSIDSIGLHIKSMLWYVPGSIGDLGAGHGPENVEFTSFIQESGGEAILDNRLPKGRFSSHHQKFMVLGDAGHHIAFVGGIDIAPDRWDTPRHNSSDLREPELFSAWHDVQIKILGPAVAEIWDSFQERWNDSRVPHEFPAVGNTSPQPLASSERPQIADTFSTHSIQIIKTFACKSNAGNDSQTPYPFAPNGLYSYQAGLVKAIDNAEHFIYIEDQYFWPCEVTEALSKAVDRGVAVILVLTKNYDVPGLTPYHNFLRNQAITQLQNAESNDQRVFVFHLEQEITNPETQEHDDIYVHSKTVIIDDRYVVIGSANINRRSMTTDSEIGVAIVDTDSVDSTISNQQEIVSKFAIDYRKALWAEHLVKSATEIADDPFDEGYPAGFPKDEGLVGHLRKHTVGQPRFCQINLIPFGLMNAQTTCL